MCANIESDEQHPKQHQNQHPEYDETTRLTLLPLNKRLFAPSEDKHSMERVNKTKPS